MLKKKLGETRWMVERGEYRVPVVVRWGFGASGELSRNRQKSKSMMGNGKARWSLLGNKVRLKLVGKRNLDKRQSDPDEP